MSSYLNNYDYRSEFLTEPADENVGFWSLEKGAEDSQILISPAEDEDAMACTVCANRRGEPPPPFTHNKSIGICSAMAVTYNVLTFEETLANCIWMMDEMSFIAFGSQADPYEKEKSRRRKRM